MSIGGGKSRTCPFSPSTHPLRSLDKLLLSAACSQVLSLLSWEPGAHRCGPSGAAREGGSHRASGSSTGSSHSCCLFGMIQGTGHCHHPPPASTIEGSRAGPRAGAPPRGPEPLLLRASLGQLQGEPGMGPPHFTPTGPPGGPCFLTAARPAPPQGTGNCRRPRAGVAGPPGAGSLQRGCDQQAGREPPPAQGTTDLGATLFASSVDRCTDSAGSRSGP